MEYIESNPDKPWNWEYVSLNPNLTLKMLNNHTDKPWDWRNMTYNPCLMIDMIDEYEEEDWDWHHIKYHHTSLLEKDYENELKKLKIDHFEEELMQKAHHPCRYLDWCLTEDEKKFLCD